MTRPRSPLAAVLALALAPMACGGDGSAGADAGGGADEIRVIARSLPLYNATDKGPRQDASGVAFLPALRRVFLVDDGGDEPPPPAPFYFIDLGPDLRVSRLPHDLANQHGDAEAATFDGTYVYVASSLSVELTEPRFHKFSRFKLAGDQIADAKTIEPRARILKALEALDPAWFARVEGLKAKGGGLNVEGLAASPAPGELMIGLRSPHYGDDFPGTCDEKGCSKLRAGDALVVAATGDFERPDSWSTTVHRLNLGGLGVRSIEYSPTAGGYFVLAGAVEAGWDYDFYFWRGPGAAPVRIDLPEFKKLCRPEGVAEVEKDRKKHLLVVSEDSGKICEEPPVPYNYLLIELNAAFLAKL